MLPSLRFQFCKLTYYWFWTFYKNTDLRKRFWKLDMLPNLYTSCSCITDILNPQFYAALKSFIRVCYHQFSNLKTFVLRLTYHENKVYWIFLFVEMCRLMRNVSDIRAVMDALFIKKFEICAKVDFLMNSVLGLEPFIEHFIFTSSF